MDEGENVCCDPDPKKKERSPSPEPFKEPEGMVTIDLNRQSPPPVLNRRKLVKPKKVKQVKSLSYSLLIILLCMTSFIAALFIHRDDIKWFASKLVVKNSTETLNALPDPLTAELNEKIPIEAQTCPVDIREEYKIQLLICEKNQTFDACCHIFLRSNLPIINEYCSVIELLDLLIEYRNLFLHRNKRHYNQEYNENDYNIEMKKKLESKLRTKKKITAYLQQLNEPLRREIPALWNMFGNMFFGSQDDDEETFEVRPVPEDHQVKDDYMQNKGQEVKNLHHHHGDADYQVKVDDKDFVEGKPSFIMEQKEYADSKNIEEQIHEENERPNIEYQISIPQSTLNIAEQGEEEAYKQISFPSRYEQESPKIDHDVDISSNNQEYIVGNQQQNSSQTRSEIYTSDVPTAEALDPTKSIFDLAWKNEREQQLETSTSEVEFKTEETIPEQIKIMNNMMLQRAKRDQLYGDYPRRNDDIGYEPQNDYNLLHIDNEREYEAEYNPNSQYGYQPGDYPQNLVGNAPVPLEKIHEGVSEDRFQHPGYHSVVNEENAESRDQQVRLPIDTDERNFGRLTRKEFQLFFPSLPYTPQEYTHEKSNSKQLFSPENGVLNQYITYSYSDLTPPTSPKPFNPTEDMQYRTDQNSYEENVHNHVTEISSFESKTVIPHKTPETLRGKNTEIRVEPTDMPTIPLPDMVDATDSIQDIDNIHGSGKSVRVDFKNTNILLSKSKQHKYETTEFPDTAVDKQEIMSRNKNYLSDENVDKKKEFFARGDNKSDIKLASSEVPTEGNDGRRGNENDAKVSSELASTRGSSNMEFRGTQQQTDFNVKSKGSPFPSVSEVVQSSQNTITNPCFYAYPSPFTSPYRYAMPYENPQVLNVLPQANVQKPAPVYVINPSVFSYAPPSPVISHYGPINQHYNPYGYVNTIAGSNSANGPVQVASSNGQYYLCNPIAAPANNHIATIPGVEIRRSHSDNLQDAMDRVKAQTRRKSSARASLNCPMDEQSCLDGSKCISLRHVCDNEVHCGDGSDEMFCSCRDRIGEIRLCDGYFDCPDGEDERGCFGCAEDEMSCDDWSRFRKGTCVPLSQRCDGIRQCDVTGKDEDDCSILTDHIGEQNPIKISNAAGFLHRNFKGKWYPTCFGSEIWAMDVCKIEAGPSTIAPKSHLIPTSEKYEGEFINILPNQQVSLVNTCVQDRASFVECPPLFCGLRMTVRNPYRSLEVDTSVEDIVNHINRGNNVMEDAFDYSRNVVDDSNKTSEREGDPVLGNERVVGGKPSQPAAWPWVVSIYKNGIFHCGGVIINELWIVTAAHCVDKYWQFYYEVQAGILRRFSYSPMEQTRWVVAAIPHEDYEKSNLKNDIALMRLSSPIRYNRYVRPICLPSETTAGQDFQRGPSAGTICTTVGWGATVEHGTDPDHMREVQVPVLKSCKHREDEEGHEICAGLFEGGKDACQGDSGGPFMCQNPNNPSQWYLAGIVSHGEGCARPNEPGVYTRVSQYIGWIAENIREGNFFPRNPLQRCPGYVCKGMNKCIPKKRHCDKIVDCLLGDDEVNCENTFHNIFKHSRGPAIPFFRTNEEDSSPFRTEEQNNDEILGAVIINADNDDAKITTEGSESTTENNFEEMNNSSDVSYKYERTPYFNNNTADPNVFRCKRLLQIIPIQKRCNKVIDCEDATDEENCKCVDYLNLKQPNAICDGTVDCSDETDEIFCYSCRNVEFNCKWSQMCISLNKRCDGKPDCTKGEDEWDCIALTNGRTIIFDKDFRPNLNMDGVISVNHFGIWKPFCASNTNKTRSEAEIATNVCNYLGFEEYTGFKKLMIDNRPLSLEWDNSDIVGMGEDSNVTKCDGLYLWCSNITLNNDAFKITQRNIEVDSEELFDAPWKAVIYADGVYKCMGVVLDEQWILTSANCFDGIISYNFVYLAVLLGNGNRNLDVAGPHEKYFKVTKSVQVNETDIVLLKLEHPMTFNRYIQPTHLHSRNEKDRDEKCIAVGNEHGRTKFLLLKSNNTCPLGRKCFNPLKRNNCTHALWSGVITCNAGNGWYPASVFETKNGSCGFNNFTNFTSIRYWARKINELKKDDDNNIPSISCDGFLCNLGNCIEKSKICDGIPHCRSGEDEDSFLCENRSNSCHLSGNCECAADQMTCANGSCVPKGKFCDRIDDCGDFSDEPSLCTCRAYLQVAHPHRICDGEIHCFDRSDEDPRLCPCKLLDFKCGQSNFCITNEMVCDGVEDCPEGEDERKCYSLISNNSDKNVGEVLTRTAGQLLNSCFIDTPTRSNLDELCKQLGFTSCIGHQLLPYHDGDNTTLVPVTDSFDVVWIRRDRKLPLMYRMRTGNNDYLSFRKQDNCHRLHVECI